MVSTLRSPSATNRSASCSELRQVRGAAAFVGRQVRVARAHRQAVRLADNRAHADVDRHVQVGHHLPHDERLLIILAAEVGPVGRRELKQFQHDRGHAAKMRRPKLAFQHLAQSGRHRRTSCASARTFRLPLGANTRSQPRLPKQRQIAVADRADTCGNLRPARTASGFTKIGDDRQVALGPRGVEQAQMAFVKRAHRGHEADSLARPAVPQHSLSNGFTVASAPAA